MASPAKKNSAVLERGNSAVLERGIPGMSSSSTDYDVKTLVFHKTPFTTAWYSGLVVRDFLISTTKYCLTHWLFLFVVLPITIVWTALAHIDGVHTEGVTEATFNLKFVVWWLFLGIMSSIGLGSGAQTGTMFLFPHILKVVYSAELCHSVDFNSRANMWFNPDIPTTSLEIPCEVHPDAPMPTWWEMYSKIIGATLIWGIGTAIGEIPPYQFSYMAAVAGEIDEDFQAELDDAKNTDADLGIMARYFNRMKAWMVDFIQRNGFWGVYLMSAWPNFAFDLCGMCCGHFKMDFWTFISATILGKAFTLRTIQAVFLVALFSSRIRPVMIETIGSVVPVIGPPTAAFLQEKIDLFIEKISGTGGDSEASSGLRKYAPLLWGLFITGMVLVFVKSSLEAFAQQYVKDERKAAARSKKKGT